jgi:predicted DNA-binding transcriptional regulator AlpA
MNDELVKQSEAKRIAGGVSDMTFWRWRREGKIPPPIQIGKRNYWRRSELMAVFERQRAVA